jgi:hypothetical protein
VSEIVRHHQQEEDREEEDLVDSLLNAISCDHSVDIHRTLLSFSPDSSHRYEDSAKGEKGEKEERGVEP